MKKEDTMKTLMLYTLWAQAISWRVIPAETDIAKDAANFSEWLETHWDDWSELEKQVTDAIDSNVFYKNIPKEQRYIWKGFAV